MRIALIIVVVLGGCDTSALNRFHAAPDGGGGSGGDGGTTPDFSLSASSPFVMVRQGGSQSATITITRMNGFSQPVPISVNGLPAGVAVDPLTLPDGVSMGALSFHASTTAAQGGPITLTITGNAGGISRDTALGLIVAGAPGTLDLSFGSGGKITVSSGVFSGATGIAVQPDGKIVVSGAIGADFMSSQMGVLRFNSDGTPDSSFGAGGRASFSIQMQATAAAIALQPDSKILLVGYSRPTPLSGTSNFALARFGGNGSVDTGFGSAGAVTTDFGNNTGEGRGVVLQPDGRIVVAGKVPNKFALARYLGDGTLDSTFGGGKFTTTFGSMTSDAGLAGGIDSAGRILVAGLSITSTATRVAVARYAQSDGSPDASFGQGGQSVTAFDSVSGDGMGLAVYGDGKVLVAATVGHNADMSSHIGLMRYSVNGIIDFSFGSVGVSELPAQSEARAVMLADDGKILVAGTKISGMMSGNPTRNFAVARFSADGSPDASFGANTGDLSGLVSFDFGMPQGYDLAIALAREEDGRILVAGAGSVLPNQIGFAVVRIWP